jgi:hypothetical protein
VRDRSMRRIGVVFASILLVVAGVLIGLYVTLFLEASPPAVEAATVGPKQAALTLQTVAEVGHGETKDWVSYYARNPAGRWVHSTILRVPANSLIHVTVYQYDGASGLRNPLWGQPRGIVGGVMYVDGKPLRVLNPELTSHAFAIPELGVSVPLAAVSEEAPNQCSNAPCGLAEAHRTITFTFRTHEAGKFRWQCFVPCAAGFIFGFGGPMQTIGYMDGELEVV